MVWAARLEPAQVLTGAGLGEIGRTNVGDDAGFTPDRQMPADI